MLRQYQKDSVESIYAYLRANDDNPCVVLPTGSGKSHVLAQVAVDAVKKWGGRVIVLAHVKELLEQNAEKIKMHEPSLDVGIYSAGLNRRDTGQSVLVAGIQSVYKRACDLDAFDLIIVDEAHLIPPDGEGMYRQFINDSEIINPNVRVIGLTATPYRTSSGCVCGPDNILNNICHEVGVKPLIDQGYLCQLKSRSGKRIADTSGLHLRGGEFIASEIDELMDEAELVKSTCEEIVEQTKNRNKVLVFASGVSHAKHLQETIQKIIYDRVEVITGKTPKKERARILEDFKQDTSLFNKPLKYLINVSVLTTGFDAPNIDCVAMVRPTNSPGLYYQMVGRGLRLYDTKEDCLILDFGGNIVRHGPVDKIQMRAKRGGGDGEAPAKTCPSCQAVVLAGLRNCPECEYEFPPPELKHSSKASEAPVVSEDVDETYDVMSVNYSIHEKRGYKPGDLRTLRVEYEIGYRDYISEWICVEHSGYAGSKAEHWWNQRCGLPMPRDVEEAFDLASEGVLAKTNKITVRTNADKKWPEIVSYDIDLIMAEDPKPEFIVDWDEEDIPF